MAHLQTSAEKVRLCRKMGKDWREGRRRFEIPPHSIQLTP